jgi:uncharacterized protein (TIGR03437 family)
MRVSGLPVAFAFLTQGLLLGQLTIKTTSLPAGVVNSSYAATLSASGGATPYVWTLNGSLPAGLTLSPNQGVISGTPTTVGASQFSITVTDQQKTTSSKGFSIQILAPLLISNTSPLPGGTVGVPYTLSFSATGGLPPYSYTAQPVSPFNQTTVPSGTNLSSGGFLSGTPDTGGTFNFNVLVTDNLGTQTIKPFALTIAPPLVISTPSPLPSGGVGTLYTQTIAASGGTPPYTFTSTNAPAGLSINTSGVLSGTPTAVGTSTFRVQVTDNAKVSVVKDFILSITATAPLLQVAPLSLSFSAFAGGDSPPNLTVVILSSGTSSTAYKVTIDGGPNSAAPAWISAHPLNGATPGRVVVSVDQGTMNAGTYSARLRVTDNAQNITDVPVTLTITTATSKLDVAPNFLRFFARNQAPGTFDKFLLVRNSTGGSPLAFTTTVLSGSSWISSITPSSGQTTRNAPVFLRVRVNTQGLQVGSYHDTIRVGSAAGNVDVPISLFVAPNGPIMSVDNNGIRLQARQGGGFSTPSAFHILNIGDPTSTINWTADIVSGSDIIALAPKTGTATVATQGEVLLAATPAATSKDPGKYFALVRITDPQSLNAPQYVTVVLDLAASNSLPKPELFPNSITFVNPPAGSPNGFQISVYTSSATPVPYLVSNISSPDGSFWLSVTSDNGTASAQTPGKIVAFATAEGLRPGIYTGEIDVAMAGTVRTVNVTFVVPNLGSSAGFSAAGSSPAANCSPSQLALSESGLPNNFAVPAGWPATLSVQLYDNCGTLTPGGSVVASFSNGDPPLTLRESQAGNYTATWQPGTSTSQMTVTVRAASGTLAPATAQLNGGVAQNQTPVLARQGTLHNENPVVGGALAPGTVAQVYGSGLASVLESPGVIPLVNNYKGTFVIIGGIQAPLYFLSDGQLNVQIPNELPSNQQHVIVVSANGALTIPDQIDVIPVIPGVAAFGDGRIIAQHGVDFSLVDAGHPAKPGEFLIMYLAGMGPTNPAVKSGDPAPGVEPLARVTNQPTVTVDNQPSTLVYAGLTN